MITASDSPLYVLMISLHGLIRGCLLYTSDAADE